MHDMIVCPSSTGGCTCASLGWVVGKVGGHLLFRPYSHRFADCAPKPCVLR